MVIEAPTGYRMWMNGKLLAPASSSLKIDVKALGARRTVAYRFSNDPVGGLKTLALGELVKLPEWHDGNIEVLAVEVG